jgi:putative DNA primase/helicase
MKGTPLGSYESWSLVVGGILQYARFEHFLGNALELYEDADSESTQWEGFLKALLEMFDGAPFTVAQVAERLRSKSWNELGTALQPSDQAASLKAALPDYLAEVSDRDGFFRRRLGKCFVEQCDRRFGEPQVHLRRAGINHHAQQWMVELSAACENGGELGELSGS